MFAERPVLALRSALHRRGYRFRKDHRLDLNEGARVRPDIAFTARKVAVFVDGEAAVDENSNFPGRERYVGTDPRTLVEVKSVIFAEPVPPAMQGAAQGQLGLRIGAPVGPHVRRAPRAGPAQRPASPGVPVPQRSPT